MIDYVTYLIAQQRTDEVARAAQAKAAVQAPPGPRATPSHRSWRFQLSEALHHLADRLAPASDRPVIGPRYTSRRRRLCDDRMA